MKWNLNSPIIDQNDLVLPRVLSDGDIPVFLVSTNSYPSFINNYGERHTCYPHVEVSLAIAIINGHQCINHYYITASGPEDSKGWKKYWRVASAVQCGNLKTGAEINSLIISLAGKISEATEICRNLENLYTEASCRLSVLNGLKPRCQTRTGYEAACAVTGVEALTDQVISESYDIGYGNFTFPEYSPEHIIQMSLAAARKSAISQPQTSPGSTPRVERNGQVWEPCSLCGCEPVYLPLHLCDTCWPEED